MKRFLQLLFCLLLVVGGHIEAKTKSSPSIPYFFTGFTDDFSANTGTQVSFSRMLGGVQFNYTFTSQGDGGDMVWENANGLGNSSSINLQSASYNPSTIERFTITRTDGADFTFTRIYIDNAGGETVTVAGYNNGIIVGNGQTVSMGGATTVNFGGIAVDEVRITSSDFFNTNIDDFVGDTNPPPPTITSATYNVSTETLAVTGTGFTATAGASNDVNVSKLTLTGEGGATYTLTSSSVEIASATSFSVTLNATDKAAINQIFNKNGTSSTGSTTYNLAGAAGFIANASATADLTGNGITVTNVAAPTITSAAYNASTGVLAVTGTGLLKLTGATNDIVVTKLTLLGQGGTTYTLTSSSVEIINGTSFTVTLNTADKAAVNQLLNKNGAVSTGGTTYNLAAAEDWNAGADAAVVIADATGNGITVSNVAPTVTGVTSSTANNSYKVGDAISIQVNFSENVTVTGTPQLTLETGTLDRVVNYSTGSGTSTLTFNYTVQAGDTSADLDYVSTTALSLNSGTIKDAAGNNATLTLPSPGAANSLGANKNIVISTAPKFTNLNGDYVTWAGVANTVVLDALGNATISDAELDALNGGNGNYAGASLTVQRAGTAVSSDTFGFNTTGALFTVSGSNLQSGGLTFATFTNTGGVLTITFTSSGTTATKTLVNEVLRRINYRNDTPAGDATVRFTFSDGVLNTTANVTVTSDTIYITNTSDTQTIDVSNGVSFSEAVAIAAADATGSQILVFSSAFNTTVSLSGSLAINESLTINADAASGLIITGGYTISLGGGTTLTWTNTTGTTALNATLGGAGSLVKAGTGTLVLGSVSNEANMSGGITVNAGTLQITSDDHLSSGTLTLNGGTLVAGTMIIDNAIVLGAGGGTFNTTGTLELSGIVSGTGALTKLSGGSLYLNVANNFSGGLNINGGMVAAFNSSSALGSGLISLASGTQLGFASITGGTLSNNIQLVGDATIINSNFANTSIILSGVISESGGSRNLTLNASSGANSSITLSGTNTYTGTTTIRSGIISINNSSNIGSGAIIMSGVGNVFRITGANVALNHNITLSSNAIVSNDNSITLSGIVSGSGSLTKTGAGILTLSGTNTYSGSTSVTAGTLNVNGSLGSTAALTVASGATVAGTGSVFAAASSNTATINSGGTLAPGNSPGKLTINGNLTMASGSNLAVEINGTAAGTGYDQVEVSGNVNVTGATLVATHSYTPGNTDAYTIINKTGSGAITGTFSGLAEGGTLTAGGNSTVLTGSYLGGTGNDFTLTSPLPATVTSVTSSETDGTYRANTTIAIEVNFSEAVTVDITGGTPSLLLETGTTDRLATYVSGSGTSTLVFYYDVQPDDVAADLDYKATTSLTLNGGTIKVGALNATLTLPAPGAANSLGANKALVIDGVVPKVTSIVRTTASPTNATSITFQVVFSEPVTGVNGTDFTLVTAGSVSSNLSFSVSTSDNQTYNVTINDVTGDGTLRLNLNSSATGISDAAGNLAGGYSGGEIYVIDNTAPTTTIATLQLSDDTGFSSTDFITKTAAQTISGTLSANLSSGETVFVSLNNGATFSTATASVGANAWSLSGVTLSGSGTITVKVRDAAGNDGTAKTQAYTLDTTAPTTTIATLQLSDDTGFSSTDFITKTAAQTISGTLSANLSSGETVFVSLNNGATFSTATASVGANAWSLSGVTLSGSGTIIVKVRDAAGNDGTAKTQAYTLDTTAPAAPSTPDLQAASDKGTSNTDNITNVTTPTFSGTAESGASVTLYDTDGTTVLGTDIVTAGSWSITTSPLMPGSHTITAKVTDIAGNVGAASAGLTVVIDTSAPTASFSSTVVAGSTTYDKAVSVTVTFSEAVTGFTLADLVATNATLSSFSGSGTTYTFTLTAASSGSVAVNLGPNLAEDVAGNMNLAASQYSFNYDSTLPVTLINYTAKRENNHAKLEWKTTAEQNNNAFLIYRSGDDKQFVQIGTVAAKGAGAYTFYDRQPLNGNNYYKLVQVDSDGQATELGMKMLNFEFSALKVQLYPNPTVNLVNVAFAAGIYQSVSLYGVDGKVLQSLKLNAKQATAAFNLGNYPSGIYFVKLIGNSNTTLKVVKQ